MVQVGWFGDGGEGGMVRCERSGCGEFYLSGGSFISHYERFTSRRVPTPRS